MPKLMPKYDIRTEKNIQMSVIASKYWEQEH